tara:strand:+ start:242 stop:796 length:555 start_codon:yes stop_codon:yes gene_type:complete
MNRKEKILRQEIRRIVRATLNEGKYDNKTNENLGRATKTTTSRLDRLVDTPYMKALEKSLQVGSSQQKAAAMLMIVQKLIGNDSQAVNKLKQRLQMKSIRQSVMNMPQTEVVKEQEDGGELTGALATRKEKMEKTLAYRMLLKALEGRPATQQVDYVFDLLNALPLDDSAKQRIRMKFRQEFKV